VPYAATWTNGNAQGRLEGGAHAVRDDDPAEAAAAINRRRRLVYLAEQDFSGQVAPDEPVRAAAVATQTPPPFRNFRDNLTDEVLCPAAGGLGGEPATPSAMDWLWPVAGADENKILVASDPAGAEVGLLDQLNGSGDWTDADLAGGAAVRAVHFNELRQAIEWIRRGRWALPVYFSGGIFSMLPNTPWIGDCIANNGADELRSIGLVLARTADSPARGLVAVTALPATRIDVTADTDCTVELYRCCRAIDFTADPPTWNEYDPSASSAWTAPGGAGAGDAVFIGSLALTANVTGQLSNAALVAAVQALIDGAEQNILIRRADTGSQTIGVAAELVVAFEVDSPPN